MFVYVLIYCSFKVKCYLTVYMCWCSIQQAPCESYIIIVAPINSSGIVESQINPLKTSKKDSRAVNNWPIQDCQQSVFMKKLTIRIKKQRYVNLFSCSYTTQKDQQYRKKKK